MRASADPPCVLPEGEVSRDAVVARHLLEFKAKAHTSDCLHALGAQVGLKSGTHLRDVLRATAHRCVGHQRQILEDILEYVSAHCHSQTLIPIGYMHSASYDETPLVLSVSRSESEGVNVSETQVLKAKLYAVQIRWALVVRSAHSGEALIIAGSAAPALRVAESTCGECVLKVLDTCLQAPRRVHTLFPTRLRLIETDAGGGNIRGERLMAASEAIAGESWSRLHLHCLAHRCHSIAEQQWGSQQRRTKGMHSNVAVVPGGTQLDSLHESVEARDPQVGHHS